MMGEEGEKTTSEEGLELFLAQPVRRVVDLFLFLSKESGCMAMVIYHLRGSYFEGIFLGSTRGSVCS